MQEIKQLINDLGGDPYQILGTDPSSDAAILRKNYRSLAIKYHPDKNKEEEAKLIFLKVNQAYEFLQIQDNRTKYQTYIRAIQEQRSRVDAMDQKRRKFAEDLKRREEEHRQTQADIEKELKKRKQFFQRKMQEEEQRQSIRREVVEEIGTKKYYKLISSFDVGWKAGLSFTQKMLELAFSAYGKVDQIKAQPKRNKATITFNSIQDCTKLVQEFKHPLIFVGYHLEPGKRQHLLKALNKQKVEKIDFSLSSQNIERFKQIINRGSGLYRQE